MTQYIVRMDDINPYMDYEKFIRIVDICNNSGFKPLLGVVPDNKDDKLKTKEYDNKFWIKLNEMIKSDRVDIAMHGTFHKYVTDDAGILEKYRIKKQSEFSGLDYDEQYEKLKRGKDILEKYGIITDVFMAPSHTFDNNTLKALFKLGFKKVTDGVGLYPEKIEEVILIPQQIAIPRKIPIGLITICLHHDKMNENDIYKLKNFIERQDFVSFCDVKFEKNIFKSFINAIFSKIYYVMCLIKR